LELATTNFISEAGWKKDKWASAMGVIRLQFQHNLILGQETKARQLLILSSPFSLSTAFFGLQTERNRFVYITNRIRGSPRVKLVGFFTSHQLTGKMVVKMLTSATEPCSLSKLRAYVQLLEREGTWLHFVREQVEVLAKPSVEGRGWAFNTKVD